MRKKKIYFGRINRSNGHLVHQLWQNNRLTIAKKLVTHFNMTEKDALAFATSVFEGWVSDDAKFAKLDDDDLDVVKRLIVSQNGLEHPAVFQHTEFSAYSFGHQGFGVMRAKEGSPFSGRQLVLFKVPVPYKIKQRNVIVPGWYDCDYDYEYDEETDDYVKNVHKEKRNHTLRRAGERESSFLWWQASWTVMKALTDLMQQK